MERYIRFLLLGIFVMFGFINNTLAGYAGPTLKMPLPGGYSWSVNTIPGSYSTHSGNDYYSIDYDDNIEGDTNSSGQQIGDLGKGVVDVLAAASGKASIHPSYGAYGNAVIIDHGNGYTTVYGHLDSFTISDGEVNQGEVLGKLGTTGMSDGPHVHFQIQHDDDSSSDNEYLAGVTVEGIRFVDYQISGPYYPSTNHQLNCPSYLSKFTAVKNAYGNFIGNATGAPHPYGSGSFICIQNYDNSGSSWGTSAILFDSQNGARQAYLVRSGFWNHYRNVCGGPAGDCRDSVNVDECGPPIGDEYYNGTNAANDYGTARQDFQTCYLYWNGSVASSKFYPAGAPGWFDGSRGWQGAISYAFAEAYARNGSRNTMGEAVEQFGNPAGVHRWGNNPHLPLVQDFNNGSYGWAILMYNDDLEKAFAIHTNFWKTYQDEGPGTYGVPCSDEYEGNDGYTYQEFTSSLFQWTGSRTRIYDKIFDDCASISLNSTSAGLTKVIDLSTFTYSSLDLTSQAAVDHADLSSHPTCAVDERGSLYVVLNGQNGRIYELKTTNDGNTWSSTGLTNIAAVPLSAPGTSPYLFINPATGDRYVTFVGNNARIQLFHFNGSIWTATELTSVVSAPLADSRASPIGYIANGIVYVVFQGNDQRIWRFSVNGTNYGSLDLTGQAAVEYAMLGTSPFAVYNDLTHKHHIVFQGINQRIQRLTYNGSVWSSVEITSVVNSDLLDSASSPSTYFDPFTSYVYTIINGNNERIDLIADYHNNSWGSDELTSIVSVPLTEPGTSPTGAIDPITGHHIITLVGDNLRINQFEGPPWTSIDHQSSSRGVRCSWHLSLDLC